MTIGMGIWAGAPSCIQHTIHPIASQKAKTYSYFPTLYGKPVANSLQIRFLAE
jgi:hypothetical protein